MAEKKVIKPVALAVGAALAGSFAISGAVNAADTAENPFSISSLKVGYMLGEHEGSCGSDGAAVTARKRKAKDPVVKALAVRRKAKALAARRKAKDPVVKALAVRKKVRVLAARKKAKASAAVLHNRISIEARKSPRIARAFFC